MSHKIESIIITIKGQRVILDSDLANLYGVSTMRLNEQVTRNIKRFPSDFMFQLSFQEFTDLISQFAISKSQHGGRRKPPRVFTEYGAVMAANILSSEVAIDASIMLVRVFIKLKEVAYENSDFKKRLQALEQRVAKGFIENAEELQEIRFLISKLEYVPASKSKRIGFFKRE